MALTEGLQKTDATMAAKFDAWSQTEGMIPVPQPSKYTGWGNWLRMNEQSLAHNPQCGK